MPRIRIDHRNSFCIFLAGAAGLTALLAFSTHVQANPAAPPKPVSVPVVDYSRDIRPILASNCFACHGQDPLTRQAGLRLDKRADALASRSGGAAVTPGQPAKSGIIARINSASPEFVMPPPSSQHRLSQEQKALLTTWVRQGAPYAEHWAFTPIVKPTPPVLKSRSWVRNPIDSFILDKLQKAGLAPAPEADRYTLLRRLSLDLTGLPPTESEIGAFVNDHSPQAYEHVVDRLLASPRYGEHWARMWLDLARYADTQGYEKDNPRTIWRYRDWVIDAFNADLPYDKFTIEQLAGDLLPNPTPSQLLATAFHRNTMTNTEGGVDGEEFRVAAIKDRVDTTGQVFMGLTIGCAKCHSHKYDPISHQDYYRFYALFNQTEDANNADEYPTSPMPTEEQSAKLSALDAKLKSLRDAFWKDSPEIKAAQAGWEKEIAGTSLWTAARLTAAASQAGAKFTTRADGALVVSGPTATQDTYTLSFDAPNGPITAIRLEALKDSSLPNGGPGRNAQDQNVVTSEVTAELISVGSSPVALSLTNARADFEQGGWPASAANDGKTETGWAWSPQNGKPHVILFDLKSPITPTPGATLRIKIVQNYPKLQHGCLRVSLSGAQTSLLRPDLNDLQSISALPAAKRSAEQQKQLDETYRKTHAPTTAVWADLSKAEQEKRDLDAQVAKTPVMRELPKERLRQTRIQRRGNFMDPGDVVTPAIPEAFGALPASAPANRLAAAQWLVSKSNPLTARVAANRVWARIFGTGIVETEEDFGTQGAAPTHPELLNWLAASYRDDFAWSTKKLCKCIVMSAAYRQSSTVSPMKKRIDPRNLLLSHAPRYRLSAETIRDQALQASGLLSPKLHGPSVMPPQPDGIWRTVYSGLKWQTSPGEDRYRRGLYTFWRRSSPYPAMTTFDAGSGEFCVIRRIRTNTPLQALVTMNDPAYIEAAGALGKAMLDSQPRTPAARIGLGFQRVLSRPADTAEIARLVKLYQSSLASYRARPETASALIKASNLTGAKATSTEELASCIAVANVLLNLDETVTRQ